MLRWLWLSALIVLLDQISKQVTEMYLDPYEVWAIISHFNITLMYNRGAAFSFLADAGIWARWTLTFLALAISGILVHWLRGLQSHERWTAAALAMVLGGAIGNLIDRIAFGHVIDFIQVYYNQDWVWPTFNIADSSISIGVVMLLLEALIRKKSHKIPSFKG